MPSYQSAYGLNPVTADPLAQPGRGAPDVAANAGGNLQLPRAQRRHDGHRSGRRHQRRVAALGVARPSSSTRSSHDQGLPSLGYMNDLLYIASAIAPASFNDVTMGNNISSFVAGRHLQT